MTEMQKSLAVFSGSTNPRLAEAITQSLGVSLGNVKLEKFANGEIYARYLQSVRGADVFIVQSVAGASVNDALMETLIMVDAARRASARTITAVIAHYGYARQDRKAAAREPITAKLVANLLETSGVTRVMTIDLHQGQIQGFFDIPVDNVYASPLLLADIWRAYGTDNLIVVSPDVGGVVRARAIAKRLDDADLAIIDKRRPKANVATVMNIIGDVAGKDCVLVDDIVDTAGTLCAAAAALKQHGASKVAAYITHPVLSGAAIDNITRSALDELVVTDTIPLSEAAKACGKIRQLSVAELLAETIRRIAFGESVSSLYVD